MKLEFNKVHSSRCLCPHKQLFQDAVAGEDTGNGVVESWSALASTHPDLATLVDPLFAARKEGNINSLFLLISSKNPLYAKGEERVAHAVPRGESPARVYYKSPMTSLLNFQMPTHEA